MGCVFLWVICHLKSKKICFFQYFSHGMSSNVNVSPYFNGGWDGAVSGLPPINKYTQGSPKQHHINPRQHKSNHQLMSSCPLPSEYVIPHTLISFSLKKTYQNPTKPTKIPWSSFGVSWVFEMGLWCFGGIVVGWLFLPKRPLTREYPKHPLDIYRDWIWIYSFFFTIYIYHIYYIS